MSFRDDLAQRIVDLSTGAAARIMLVRRQAYRRCFCGPGGRLTADGKMVVHDLQRFARIGEDSIPLDSSGRADPLQMARLLGRREALERLLGHIPPDDRDLADAIAAGNRADDGA